MVKQVQHNPLSPPIYLKTLILQHFRCKKYVLHDLLKLLANLALIIEKGKAECFATSDVTLTTKAILIIP